ncbi:MAG: hypothetical protein HYU75_17100 [Betaproteobacteria bacterium]|nr:hypothetical protein [Betaproteobacteria bacterium]
MTITKQIVADQIAAYLRRGMTLAQLVEWAENAMMEGEFDEKDAATISAVVARLGVVDVRDFGLTWADCEDLFGQLGFSARIEIVAA